MSEQRVPSLRAIAATTMRENGLEPEFSPAVIAEVRALGAGAEDAQQPETQDLRSLLWSSIDNPQSRDLDQVEHAERAADDAIVVRLGVADVTSLVVGTWVRAVDVNAEGRVVRGFKNLVKGMKVPVCHVDQGDAREYRSEAGARHCGSEGGRSDPCRAPRRRRATRIHRSCARGGSCSGKLRRLFNVDAREGCALDSYLSV